MDFYLQATMMNYLDIVQGIVLDQGGFNTVMEVKKIRECTLFETNGIKDEDNVDTLYAVKQIRHDLNVNERIDAFDCLEKEAMFLSALNHPNIIKI